MKQVIDYSLKLNFINIKKRLFFTSIFTFVSFFLPVFATNQIDINKIKNELGKGVNISLLEQYAAVDGELIKKLQQIYYRCSQLNIKLIIVYHYGKLSNENIYSENDRIIRIWKQIITAMKANSTNNLFFELYNEPTTDMDVWKSSVTTLVRELRKEDPERIFIIGGANYNGFNELLHMGKLDVDDGKIIYTFHFYEPYIFTHQGADWTAEKTFITGFPYPYKAKKMPRLYNAPSDSQLYKDYFRIPKESTCEYLFERIKYISNEAKSLIYRLSAQKRG